jgi:hypothetical protein
MFQKYRKAGCEGSRIKGQCQGSQEKKERMKSLEIEFFPNSKLQTPNSKLQTPNSNPNSPRHHFDGCTNAAVGNGIAHGLEHFVFAFLYGIFSLGMNKHGALFGLFGGMAAYFDERFDHPLKSIYLIVPHHEAAGFGKFCCYIRACFFPGLGCFLKNWADHDTKLAGWPDMRKANYYLRLFPVAKAPYDQFQGKQNRTVGTGR